MPQMIEIHKDKYTISTDPAKLNINAIADMLTRAYWAQGRTPEMIARYVQHSLVFGLYHEGKQVGLARVVSDASLAGRGVRGRFPSATCQDRDRGGLRG